METLLLNADVVDEHSPMPAVVDAVRDVQHEVKRTEQRLLLDSVR